MRVLSRARARATPDPPHWRRSGSRHGLKVISVLQRMLGEAKDPNIRVYRICRDCLEVVVGIGSVRSTPDEGACVIV